MRIKDKINLDQNGLLKHGPITIVALGDSVTPGAFEPDCIDYNSVYHNLLAKKINYVNNYVPVNVINAGIGGTTATLGVSRLDSQVLAHNPDLVIVCFGLNDVNNPLNEYLTSLKIIFEKCNNYGVETVFLTPNMLNTYVANDTAKQHLTYAKITADMQNEGKMDNYIYSAIDLAKSMGVKVADVYSKWKELSKTTDTTLLLANYINHPTREMHELFANEIFNCIFDGEINSTNTLNSTMFEK